MIGSAELVRGCRQHFPARRRGGAVLSFLSMAATVFPHRVSLKLMWTSHASVQMYLTLPVSVLVDNISSQFRFLGVFANISAMAGWL
jgi:hypothetical protein